MTLQNFLHHLSPYSASILEAVACFGIRSNMFSEKKTIYDPKYRKLIASLVETRYKAGINQRELAQRLGIPNSIIAKIEICERRLDILEFIEILRVLDNKKAESVEKLISKI